MSYILEALRRAETERGRKRGVPGLHAQQVPTPSPGESAEPGRKGPWLWVVIGLTAGVLLPLLWRWWANDPASEEDLLARAPVAGSVVAHASVGVASPSSAEEGATAAAPAAATTNAAPAVAQQPASAAQAAPVAPKAAASGSRAGAPAKPAVAARSHTLAAAPHTATPPAPFAVATANPGPGTSAGPTGVAAPASAPEARLRTLSELPDDMRRSVPTLAFGGSVYSEVAAQRMVIFNGQVLREGDALTDELLLEQIRPRSAVLRLRGQRFEVTF